MFSAMLIFGAALVYGASDRFREFAGDFREAARVSNMSMKQVSLEMGLSEDGAQLQRELSGVGNLSARRMAELPPVFWQNFNLIRARRVGLPAIARVANDMGRAL